MDTDTRTRGSACEDEGRQQAGASTSQGALRAPSKPAGGGEGLARTLLTASDGPRSAGTLLSGLQPAEHGSPALGAPRPWCLVEASAPRRGAPLLALPCSFAGGHWPQPSSGDQSRWLRPRVENQTGHGVGSACGREAGAFRSRGHRGLRGYRGCERVHVHGVGGLSEHRLLRGGGASNPSLYGGRRLT